MLFEVAEDFCSSIVFWRSLSFVLVTESTKLVLLNANPESQETLAFEMGSEKQVLLEDLADDDTVLTMCVPPETEDLEDFAVNFDFEVEVTAEVLGMEVNVCLVLVGDCFIASEYKLPLDGQLNSLLFAGWKFRGFEEPPKTEVLVS